MSSVAAVRLPEVGNKFEDKQELFGLGENKHYVLLANTYDCTFLKNRLTFYLAQQLGMKFVPQGVNIELYVNDEYLGNHLFCERVRIGGSRIEIEELLSTTTHLALSLQMKIRELLSKNSTSGIISRDVKMQSIWKTTQTMRS